MHTTITFDNGVSFGILDNGDGGAVLLYTPAGSDTTSVGIKLTAGQFQQFADALRPHLGGGR